MELISYFSPTKTPSTKALPQLTANHVDQEFGFKDAVNSIFPLESTLNNLQIKAIFTNRSLHTPPSLHFSTPLLSQIQFQVQFPTMVSNSRSWICWCEKLDQYHLSFQCLTTNSDCPLITTIQLTQRRCLFSFAYFSEVSRCPTNSGASNTLHLTEPNCLARIVLALLQVLLLTLRICTAGACKVVGLVSYRQLFAKKPHLCF